jgi:murein DD-endopeptidase MepM/ murein hydrolase activator NlpD
VAASNRSNGKYVKIRHPNGWMTMYNHLSRFGKGIRKGATVQQGQRIGYVGSTGLSTGPHLDFRMYRGGVAVNPLTIKSPPARPVSKAQLAAFKAMVAERTALLEKGDVLKRASLKLPSARPVHIRM